MLRFLKGLLGSGSSFDADLQPEGRIYAIGDVHGRDDLLARLLQQIDEDRGGADARIVILGDLVDRGEETRAVLDRVSGLAGRDDVVVLLGNHEEMLLSFLADPDAHGERWLRFGGRETLMSYGIAPGEDLGGVAADLRAAMGGHLDFLERLRLFWQSGNVAFVHAITDPAKPIDEQDRRTLLWGRPGDHGPRRDAVWTVHGHTIVGEPLVDRGRINVDTGAYYSGVLSAARIEPGALSFLST